MTAAVLIVAVVALALLAAIEERRHLARTTTPVKERKWTR